MSITRTLDLTFTTEANQTQRISISEARSDLDNNQINSAMNNIISYNIFSGQGGNLVGKKAAQLVIREVQPFEMA